MIPNYRLVFFSIFLLLFFLLTDIYAKENYNLFQRKGSPNRLILGIENVDDKKLETITINSIKISADYLKSNIDQDGKFVYLNFLNGAEDKKQYNELRHAGTVYSLELYYEEYPDDSTLELIKRASSYLKDCCIFKVPGKKNLTAVWTNPYRVKNPRFRKAKLGGAGLALVSLVSLKKIENSAVDLALLRQLADFILYLQNEDGSFYSKYKPLEGGRDDSWTSLYYPGEAALGLAMLYEIDKDPKWIKGAVNTITYLAKSRKNKKKVNANNRRNIGVTIAF